MLLHLDQGSSDGSTTGSLVVKIRPKDLLLRSGVVDVKLKTSLLSKWPCRVHFTNTFDVNYCNFVGLFFFFFRMISNVLFFHSCFEVSTDTA